MDDGLEVESEDGDDEEEDVEVADEELDALESELGNAFFFVICA